MSQSRRMLVLRAVVEDYIETLEPVGSSAIARNHNIGVSPATIRNDMAMLEKEGYLVQPHTSAGRIPTERGYRYFVDKLATIVPLAEAQRRGIQTFLSGSVNLKDTLQRSARLLAKITGQVAVIASPSITQATLRHVELVALSSRTLLAIIITDTGNVVQHVVKLQELPNTTQCTYCSDTINRECVGLSFEQAANHIRSITPNNELNTAIAQAFDSIAQHQQSSELYVYGASSLAHQHMRADEYGPLFDALEEQVVLMKLMANLSQSTDERGVGVAIGSETNAPQLMNAAVVTSGYGKHETQPVAFVGSIGPKYMNYPTTIAAVQAVARYLTAFISDDNREQNPDRSL